MMTANPTDTRVSKDGLVPLVCPLCERVVRVLPGSRGRCKGKGLGHPSRVLRPFPLPTQDRENLDLPDTI